MSDSTVLRPSRLPAEIQGSISLPDITLRAASALAASQYQSAVDAEFSGDPVETYELPAWLPPVESFLPHEHLCSLGLERNHRERAELVGTCGVDPHVDQIHGVVMIVVLHNDGLTFRQGRVRHAAAPGQWFVFDDRKSHQVIETKRSTCYLALAVPLRLAT